MSNPEEVQDDEWQRIWDARAAALAALLGKPTDRVWHALVPFFLGGEADVLEFPEFVPGYTYVTAELTGTESGQRPSSLGSYELMVCTQAEATAAANLIAKLARYTCDAVLEPGETMDIGGSLGDSTLRALLFTHPADEVMRFSVEEQECGLLLCLGITGDELAFARTNGSQGLIQELKAKKVFPYTVPDRPSVVTAPRREWRRFFGK